MTGDLSQLRENHMIDRCVKNDSMSCDPSHITWNSRSEGDVAGVTMSGVNPHALVNHMVFFYAMVLLYLCI